jgi:hypothetical protein
MFFCCWCPVKICISQAVVSIHNYQKYRHIQAPGWHLGWAWTKKEVIWSILGGQATEQGDCSHFKDRIPHCCKTDPVTVDLLPGSPFDQQVANCCKGGVLSSWLQDPVSAVASFQITVGRSGTSNRTVKPPTNFTLKAPGPGYTCGLAQTLKPPTKFISPDGRRTTQAHGKLFQYLVYLFSCYKDITKCLGIMVNITAQQWSSIWSTHWITKRFSLFQWLGMWLVHIHSLLLKEVQLVVFHSHRFITVP